MLFCFWAILDFGLLWLMALGFWHWAFDAFLLPAGAQRRGSAPFNSCILPSPLFAIR